MPRIELVRLRLFGKDRAVANVRVDSWHLQGLFVQAHSDGSHRISWPMAIGADGRFWPILAPPPGVKEAVEAAIRAQFVRVCRGAA